MFPLCEEVIERSKGAGVDDRTIMIMEGCLVQAGRYWANYDYPNTEMTLQRILELADQSS